MDAPTDDTRQQASPFDQGKRVYASFSRRVDTFRNRPTWLQRLIAYILLFVLLGLGIVLGVLALIVGAVLAVAVAAYLGVRKLVALVTGKGPNSNAHDPRRANVRVIPPR